ncbi:MAG: wax ester/triacylglycerol synthase family O-acyltransferase [Actinobacteria bacterium]|nr:wax ester/triacylglycerol synthase family O-acyltransferase [Actinomycetota bacterium]
MATKGDRLTGLDSSFLHLESDSAHMHVAAVMLFDGAPPTADELIEAIESRLHLVPRYRQKLAFVPFGQGRPRWVDDPHLNLRYHVRSTGLPSPGTEAQLRALAGRILSQKLDRDKPLWEIWVVEGLDGGERFAVISKTHHALVDGISGVDIISVLYDTSPEPKTPPASGKRWLPRPVPSRTQLLGEALLERATVPAELVRGVRAAFRAPRRIAEAAVGALAGVGAMAWAGINPAPPSPYNVDIGPHRRFTWVRVSLADVKQIKNALGGTVNDVMLAIVAGGLGRDLRRRGVDVRGLELKAMVPVSVRGEEARGALGNQVAAMMAPLPVGCDDPQVRFGTISTAMGRVKDSGQAVGAQVLTELTGFAPPNVMSQASRVVARQRWFNLVVTNVPGPQLPLYLMGREMIEIFPMVPLAERQALGVAIMSYNGKINFGLVGDYDVMADVDQLAKDLRSSLAELAEAAGVELTVPEERRPRARNGHRPRRQVGTREAVAATTAGDGEGGASPPGQ